MNDEHHEPRRTPPPAVAAASPANDVPPVETLGPVAYLEIKAAALLLFTLALILGSGLYLLYARGAFEPTQTLVLTADDSEGVVVGMDMTFSGFPIGRVRRIELADTGNARIIVDVPRKDAHWLRESSVFTLVRGIVGGTNIRAYTGMLDDKPLADGAVRPVLRGDATAEIPQLMASARELLSNLNALSAQDGALGGSLANVQALTERLNGPGGVLGVLMGNEADARKIVSTLSAPMPCWRAWMAWQHAQTGRCLAPTGAKTPWCPRCAPRWHNSTGCWQTPAQACRRWTPYWWRHRP